MASGPSTHRDKRDMNGTNRKLPAAKTGQGHGPLYNKGPSVPFRPGAFPEGSITSSTPPPPPIVRLSKSQAVDLACQLLQEKGNIVLTKNDRKHLFTLRSPCTYRLRKKDRLTRIVFRVPTVFACVSKSPRLSHQFARRRNQTDCYVCLTRSECVRQRWGTASLILAE